MSARLGRGAFRALPAAAAAVLLLAPLPAVAEPEALDTAVMARRVSEACVFGAAAGAAGAVIAGAPIAASGLAAPSVFSIALGAAVLGCTVGFVGATAASGFTLFWDRKLQPELERGRPLPELGEGEIRASAEGGGWRVLRTSLDLVRRRDHEGAACRSC